MKFLTLAVLAIEENEPMDFSQPCETRRKKRYKVQSPCFVEIQGMVASCKLQVASLVPFDPYFV